MRNRKPFVNIIIVNYNGKHLLEKCLNSVFNIKYPKTKYEVIVVDNCSKDDSVNFVKKKFPKTKIIKNNVNNYCRANNIAIKKSEGKYVVLLNNDTEVNKNWLDELVKVLEKDISIGVASSISLYRNETIQNAGLIPLPDSYWEERGAGKKTIAYSKLEKIPAVSNISALYRRKALKEIGLFDEDFQMYYEDVDISYRLKKAGWKLFFVPKSIVYHDFHGTATEELAQFYIERNRLLFIAKHYPDKLSDALLGNSYFISNKSSNVGSLFSMIPIILYKFLENTPKGIPKQILDNLFSELEKILNYENKILSKKLLENYKDVVGKNKILRKVEKKLAKKIDVAEENKKQIDKYKEEILRYKDDIKKYRDSANSLTQQVKDKIYENLSKDGEILEKENKLKELSEKLSIYKSEIEGLSDRLKHRLDEILIKKGELLEKDVQLKTISSELEDYKEETENLSNILKDRLDELSIKNGELVDKDNQISQLSSEVEDYKKELSSIYNSEGYKFVLKPLWWFIFHMRLILKFIIKKIFYLIITLFSFILSPVFIFMGLVFIFEEILWNIFGPLFKKVGKKKRAIVPFENLKISLVIPNWNGLDYLEKCLTSIFNLEDFESGIHEVLVVDDASTDDSVKYIEENFSQVRLFKNKKNRKFGYTCNKAVKKAKNDLIVLINNDIVVTEDFLEPLIKHFKDESIFAVSPKLYKWDKKTFNFGMHMGRFENGYVRFWNESETGNGDKINQTSPSLIAVGGAMVFRKNDFLWLGGFDYIFKPNCWEDIDISYRAWKRGLKVLYEPQSLLYHKDAATVSYEKHKEIKNELLFTWKNITDWNIFKNHLNLFPLHFVNGRVPFIRGFLWALRYLPQALVHRFKERIYSTTNDRVILDGCIKYYRDFKRRNFQHSQKDSKKTILLISRFIPYPLNVGGKVRIYNLIKSIKDKYNIILLGLIDREDEKIYIPELRNIFNEVYLVYQKNSTNFLFPNRYRFSFSEALIEKMKEIQKIYPIDVVHIESNELLYLSKYTKHVPIIYTEHDISLMSFNKSYYRYKRYLLLQEFYDYLKRVNFHNKYYKKIDRVISLSKKDIKIIKSFFPYKIISYIPTGTDINYFRYNYSFNGRKRIIYIGHYLHYPNEEAVVYFAKKIFPKIKKKAPNAEFLIVGSGVTDGIQELSSIEGIKLIGEVDEVKSYLYKSDVFVNPTRISAGIKGKVLEAFACGVPVVSTSKGIWGLESKPNKDILLADNSDEFANKVIELLQNKELHKKLAVNGRKLVEYKYDWNNIGLKLDAVYKDVISKYDLYNNNVDIKKKIKKFKGIKKTPPLKIADVQEKSIFPKRFSLILSKVKKRIEEIIESTQIAGPELGPEELHIELTYRCQSRCIMCDVWDYEKRKGIKDKELSLDEIKKFVKQSSYLKRVNTIVLSGGEPFLRDDLVDICGYFISNYPKACINILTNMIDTDNILQKTEKIIEEYKPNQLWLSTSMDGIEGVHDKVRGYKGAFNNLVNTLKQCRKKFPFVKLAATFTATPYNSLELLKVRNFCQNIGLDFFAQFAIQKETREKLVWTEQDFNNLEKDINFIIKGLIAGKNYNQIKNDPAIMSQLYYWSHLIPYQKEPVRFFKKCVAGSRFAMFSPYGEMFFCPVLKDKVIGNIRDINFDRLWMSKNAKELRDYINKGNCHCWLLCAVYPLLNEVLNNTIKAEKREKDRLIERNTAFDKDNMPYVKSKNEELQSKNELFNNREFQSNKVILNSYPQEIGIGAHYFCNAKCKFCKTEEFPNFSLEIYKNFFEKKLKHVFPYIKNINLCGWGELLLMPGIEKFLEYLNYTLPDKRKIITTNGTPLNKDICQMFKNNLYSIQISLHASNAGLHKYITSIGGFNNIIRNIEYLRNISGVENEIKISLKSTLTTLNLEDLPNLVDLASKVGVDKVECNYMTIYDYSHIKLSCFFQQDLTNKIFDEAEKIAFKNGISLDLPPRFKQADYKNHIRCSDPWKYFYVETQGSVTPCCYAAEHIGYLNRDEFEAIWNNLRYQNLRKNLIEEKHDGWCQYCYKSNPNNVNDIRSHISFRPEIQNKILPKTLVYND